MTDFTKIAQSFPSVGEKEYIGLENAVKDFVSSILSAMFPLHFGKTFSEEKNKQETELQKAYLSLTTALSFVEEKEKVSEHADLLFARLPDIAEILHTDIISAYQGDPAAHSYDEIILTYPAFKAISVFRIAHELYMQKIPVLPRMMTEFSHRETGIDIHPGATIGKYFFIDHGTGVVIGETTTIGEHVKLYQHVTLGAKNFEIAEDGSLVKGIKRHPDIGNHVVIYAGATILGGNTVIGDNCVIGGNVWLTHSVEAGKTVTIRVYSQN